MMSAASDCAMEAPAIPMAVTTPAQRTITRGALRRSKIGAAMVPTPTMAKHDAGTQDASD